MVVELEPTRDAWWLRWWRPGASRLERWERTVTYNFASSFPPRIDTVKVSFQLVILRT